MQDIHNRMPVFLHPSEWGTWLDPKQDFNRLNHLLDPFQTTALTLTLFLLPLERFVIMALTLLSPSCVYFDITFWLAQGEDR